MANLKSTGGLVAVLLPRGELFEQIYRKAIVPGVEAAGLQVELVAIDLFDPTCRTRAEETVKNAQRVIVDFSGRSPSVAYLAGYATAVGKEIISIARDGDDFLFHEEGTFSYAGDPEPLREHLRKLLGATSRNGAPPKRVSAKKPQPALAKFQELFGDVLAAHEYQQEGSIRMENPTTFVLEQQEMPLALVQALANKAKELGFRLKLL